MLNFFEMVNEISGGCMVGESVFSEENLAGKRAWLEENAQDWSEEQKETFLRWADWNMLKNEWVLSPSAVGKILGCATQTIQKKCKDGKIKAYQNTIGWWHIPIDQVVAML